MKIIFFGSAHFAVLPLEALIKSRHELLCVVTQPDKKKGRHLKVGFTDVKNTALSGSLRVFQPKDVNDQESVKFLKSLNADLFVIVAYGQILSQEVLDIPSLMPINIHASLLPRYRGAAPINWAVINGDKKTGVTIMHVVAKMDAGPSIARQEIKIQDQETAVTLEAKLSICGAQLLIDALGAIEKHDYRLVEQQEEEAVYAPKLKKDTGLIDWNNSAVNIYNQIRGVVPWPGAFTSYRKKMLKIFAAQVLPIFPGHQPVCGEVIRADEHGIVVACGRGFLEIKELQLAGGKRMLAQSFISGHKLAAGETLGKK